MFDAIIIGGGAAGLSAALTLGRSHRTTLVCDSGQPRNEPAAAVHNFLSRDGTPPGELYRIAREQVCRYPSVRFADAEVVEAAQQAEGAFEVGFADGRTEQARRLLFATGVIDELPPIEGMAAMWGQTVFHCPYCHGYEITGQTIAVLGADLARLALHLTRFSGDVVLCTNGADELEAGIRPVLDAQGVAVHSEPITRLDGRDGQLECIVFREGPPLARQALFTGAVLRQKSGLPAAMGCGQLEDGTIEVNELGQTSVPGVYAAGDMARRESMPGPPGTVVLAAASGSMAASVIDKDLLYEDVGLEP